MEVANTLEKKRIYVDFTKKDNPPSFWKKRIKSSSETVI